MSTNNPTLHLGLAILPCTPLQQVSNNLRSLHQDIKRTSPLLWPIMFFSQFFFLTKLDLVHIICNGIYFEANFILPSKPQIQRPKFVCSCIMLIVLYGVVYTHVMFTSMWYVVVPFTFGLMICVQQSLLKFFCLTYMLQSLYDLDTIFIIFLCLIPLLCYNGNIKKVFQIAQPLWMLNYILAIVAIIESLRAHIF